MWFDFCDKETDMTYELDLLPWFSVGHSQALQKSVLQWGVAAVQSSPAASAMINTTQIAKIKNWPKLQNTSPNFECMVQKC